MVARLFGLALVICSALGALARGDDRPAPTYEAPEFLKQPPPLPAGADAAAVWRLDLADALRLALRQNLGLAIERSSLQIARLGVDIARGGFEPLLTASFDHGSADIPPSSSQEAGAGEIVTIVNQGWRLSLAQRLATGMRLEAAFTTSRDRSTSRIAVEPLNYRSAVSLSVTQPLLRGFSTDLVVPRIEVLRAEIASQRERQQLAVVAADVVERTESAYWDLARALYRHDLELRSQRLAEDQLALTRRQIDAGITPPSDLISAETTLAQRTLQLVRSEQDIEQASDQLRSVLNLPRDQWRRAILPVDVPRFVALSGQPEELFAVALKNRPELAQLELDLQAERLAMRRADNDRLPHIDLGVTGSLVGQDGTYRGALDQIGGTDALGYTVFVNMTWTPLGRATSAAAEAERARHRIGLARHEQAIQDVWLAIRGAVRAQRSAALQVNAAGRFRELSTRSLEVEQRKFLNGTSSNFVVAQRQEELASAQLAELTAVLEHQKASAAVHRATGRLLDERHIELEVRPQRP
jgi:outer membrane protein TolC